MKNCLSWRGLRTLAAPLCFALGMLMATGVEGQEIRWRSNEVAGVEPHVDHIGQAAPMSAAQAAQAMRDVVGEAPSKRVVVQFSAPMSPQDRMQLAQAGVDVLSPLGSNAFFATVRSRSLNVEQVGAVNNLQLAMPVPRDVKLHHLILADDIPQWAVVGDTLIEGEEARSEPIVAVGVMFHRDVERGEALALAEAYGAVVSQFQTINGLMLELPASQIRLLADEDAVQWIEPPLPHMTHTNAENRAATQANEAQAAPYNLDGTDVVVMVYDGGVALASHSDFGGRLSVEDSDSLSNHATHVSGTIGGDGAGSENFNLRGMAPNVTLKSYGFEWTSGGIFLYTNPGDIEQDYSHAINVNNAVIANNSIGTNTATNGFPCSITGEYGLTDTIIDSIVRGELGAPIRVVWANGNERQSTRCGNEYNTTAPPACAKNHLTVGALNSDDDSMTSFSSWGPAGDGRLKPDISAPGCMIGSGNGVTSTSSSGGYSTSCGTSMASPTVAGLAALLLQDYRQQFPGGADFAPSMMKALFIHNAKDLENPGPDYMTGYGLAQVVDTIEFMRTGSFIESSVDHGQTQFMLINMTEPGELKVTIAWDDPPGTPNVVPALINDLDLRVVGPDGTFYPWTLDPDNPAAPAVRTQPDRLNNIEQVVIDAASAGIWTVEVVGYNVPEGPQSFSLTASPNVVNTGIDFPDGLPSIVMPGTATPVTVRIRTLGESIISDSAMLHTRVNGEAFQTLPMTSLGGELFEAMLPAVSCSDLLEYYFSVESTLSGETNAPSNAPSQLYDVEIGQVVEVFADDFNQDLGWIAGAPDDDATTGLWELANPVGTSVGNVVVQPSDPYVGDMCYITGQHPGGGAGANDVDHGKTTLFSPVLDASGSTRATISYVRWYSNSAGANPNNDIFEVDVSDDGGTTWVNVETVGPAGAGTSGGWIHHQFNVADFVELTDQIQVRFIASDYDPQALVEAAVDMFRLRTVVCEDVVPTCVSDFNGDNVVDVSDLLVLLSAWGPCGEGACPADLTGDGVVDVSDLLLLLSDWGDCS